MSVVYKYPGHYIDVNKDYLEFLTYEDVNYGFGNWVECTNTVEIPFDKITAIERDSPHKGKINLKIYTDGSDPAIDGIFDKDAVINVYYACLDYLEKTCDGDVIDENGYSDDDECDKCENEKKES